MGRQSCNMKQKVRKGLWSPEEDEKLYNFITRFGVGCWSSVPKLAGLQRCGKSCRLRWMNYLRPDLKRGMFTQDEEDLIINLHEALGNRWSQIASQLPGRTDNEIKNLWNSSLKKKLTKHGIDPNTHTPITQTQQDSNSPIQQQVYDHPLFFTESQENKNTDPDGYDSTLQSRFLHDSTFRINPSCGFDSSVPNLSSFDHQKMMETDYCDSHSCSSSQINTHVMINESSSNSAFSWDVENKLESYFSSGIQIEERKTNQWEESSGDFGKIPLTSLSEEFFSANINYKEL